MEEKYDIVIIGGGPAGLSSGIYAGRAGRKTLILEKGKVGGRASLTESVVNYPGFAQISGGQLMKQMREQAEGFNVGIRRETVKKLYQAEDGSKIIETRKNKYKADAVILASGAEPKILNIEGEDEFTGRGVAYCAACDAEFFKDQTVVVLGSGDQAIEESEFIARFASKVIIVVIHEEGVLDCNQASAKRVALNDKISFVWNSTITKIEGKNSVESVLVKNIISGEQTQISCQGVFFFVGLNPATGYLKGNLPITKTPWIETNERMETTFSGVFAAGDVRKKDLRQIATAVNDGAVAAVMADHYLEQKKIFHKVESQSYNEPLNILFWSSELTTGEQFTDESDIKMEVDVIKNRYLAECFGINKEMLSGGQKLVKYYQGKIAG